MITDLKYKEISEIILKSFYEVYNELGRGFLESVYENALVIVLNSYGLQTESQKEIKVYFRNQNVGFFKADIIVENKIILELKAVRKIDPAHQAQLLNYLKATDLDVGYVLNFGEKPEFKRLIFERK